MSELSPSDVIEENDAPGRAAVFDVFDAQRHIARTRRLLALVVLGIVATMYLVVVLGFVFGGLNGEELAQVISALSGLNVLSAAVVGFYFATKSD